MGNLESTLASIPGYGGYLAKRQYDQNEQMGELQKASGLMGIVSALQKQKQDQAFKAELGTLTAQHGSLDNVPQESLAVLAAKYSSPHDILTTQQKSLDRKSAAETSAAARADAASARASEAQLNRDARERDLTLRLADARATAADRQATLRELAGIRADAAKESSDRRAADAEEKGIEGQINKTSARMKDIMPVYTAARQLNEVLGRFTPETVPGIGYAKNTDIGKIVLSDEGKDVSSSQKLLGNSILKAMSGAAVTPSEEVRQMAAMMSDGRYSAHDFYLAWPKIANWVNDQVSLGTSGLTPKAKPVFEDRTGIKTDRISPRFQQVYDASGKVTLKDTRAPAESGAPPPPPGFKVNN